MRSVRIFLAALVLLSGVLLLCSCDRTEPAEETPSIPDETVQVFESVNEAKRAIQLAASVDERTIIFEPESLDRYRAAKESILSEIGSESTLEDLSALYRRIMDARDQLVIEKGDVPRIFIETTTWLTKEYSPCTVSVTGGKNDTFETLFSKGAKIKIRGKSTAKAEKKPYRIKFEDKTSVAGIEEGKSWILLANMFDKSMIRNYLALTLARDMGMTWTPECRFVDVYVDGEFMGNYLLTEAITDGASTTDIDVENGDFLFELDQDRVEDAVYVTTSLKMRMKYEEPELPSVLDQRWVISFFREMEDALKTHDMERYSAYIDVDSFVDYYIHSEFTKNVDSNQYSTRLFIKHGKLYYGPVWDYDLAMGNINGDYEEKFARYANEKGLGTGSGDSADGEWTESGWYTELFQDPAFRARLVERFDELVPLLKNVYMENELGKSLIDRAVEEGGSSFEDNYYPNTPWYSMILYDTMPKKPALEFAEEITWLKEWCDRRFTFLSGLIDTYR